MYLICQYIQLPPPPPSPTPYFLRKNTKKIYAAPVKIYYTDRQLKYFNPQYVGDEQFKIITIQKPSRNLIEVSKWPSSTWVQVYFLSSLTSRSNRVSVYTYQRKIIGIIFPQPQKIRTEDSSSPIFFHHKIS